jgi:lysophospholipid acyltransferase (LPLAT)-like uncharacterized protein
VRPTLDSRRRRWKRTGIRLVARIAPALYLAYMRLVLATTRVVRIGMEEMLAESRRGSNIALAVLHQDIVLSGVTFRDLGIVTVANVGDAGDIIAAILERCGFAVVRGGSSTRVSRRTPVLRELLGRIRTRSGSHGTIWAVTPDGSRGPAGAVKPGAAFIAMQTSSRVYCLKIHASRALYAPTWDRTAIPLPFSIITIELDGPLDVPTGATRSDLEALRAEIERRLHVLHARAFARCGREPIPRLEQLHIGGRAERRPPARARVASTRA